ncbi:MAG: CPBP family intramembrane metalloprotease [Parachlamydiaceae bacterium]|nr:CPBP family intramembrane metalloprotease [Parachlamydiaceae bacterium]
MIIFLLTSIVEISYFLKKNDKFKHIFSKKILTNLYKDSFFYISLIISIVALLCWRYFEIPNKDYNLHLNSWLEKIFLAFSFAFFNAFLEEVIFRKYFLKSFLNFFTQNISIINQAILFGLIHYNGIPSGLLGITLASIYGFIMGKLSMKYNGNLLPPIIHHFIIDIVVFILTNV